jgi:dihydroxyacid dehydratase/phosphogluconate dehydratase
VSADALPESERILSAQPARDTSGTQVIGGGAIGRSSVLKISGLSRRELIAFEDKVALVVFFAGEEEAAEEIGDARFLERLSERFSEESLLAVRRYNAGELSETDARGPSLFRHMAEERSLRLLFVIAGEGPLSNGMPEVHKPQDWVSKNHLLAPIAYLLTDARFSGTNYGPAFGHAEPEAFQGGITGYLKDGDMAWVRLSARRVDLIQRETLLKTNEAAPLSEEAVAAFREERAELWKTRMKAWTSRREDIPPSVREPMNATTAAEGVTPPEVWESATKRWDWRALMREGREGAPGA